MNNLSYPEVISIHTDISTVTPFTNKNVENLKEEQYKGIVLANGTWLQEAAAGWKIEKPNVGNYIIRHNHGHPTYSTNISLLGKPGNLVIKHMDEYTLELQIIDAKNLPMDKDFAFCMAITQKIA